MFQILLAVSQGERHGYAIMREIEGRADGAFGIGAGTLYRSIKQLVDAGLLAETSPKAQVHSQRRYYRLTPAGRRRAAAEARVFHGMVTWARDARFLDPGNQ
jgi:DNA-binding PadR family transcriptional regulator